MDPKRKKDLEIEKQIYERLESHPRICRYLQSTERIITRERYVESIRKRLFDLDRPGGILPSETALRWSMQVAQGLEYIHSKGVLQADISTGNMLLDRHNNIVLCDFAGSSIDGSKPTVASDASYQRPYEGGLLEGNVQNEIYALGSAIYEIWTTIQPYQDEPEKVVIQYFRDGQFPEVGHLPPTDVVMKCWKGSYTTVSEAAYELEQLRK
ncbi:MAG: hypothetical protein Q9217_003506 [Psora testacea]